MAVPAHDLCMSESEYFELEESSQVRHEYVAGRIWSMVGASARHGVIVSNLNHHIYEPIRQAGCRAYATDMKVKVEASQSFYYPDLVVSCERFDPKSNFLVAPCLIVEVLSPSTQIVDRREKLTAYRHIPSLTEYVLVYQDKMQIEVYRKDNAGSWHCQLFSKAGKLILQSVSSSEIELDMKDIYFGTELPD